MNDPKIKVLVADDSAVTRLFLVNLLESDPRIQVVASVDDGQAALDFVTASKPDLVHMDIHMPRMDGFEATRRIMETHPVPIVICSATARAKDVVIVFKAVEAGAVACIEKPLAHEHGDFAAKAAHLLETVKLMSEVKVVRRGARSRGAASRPPEPVPAANWQRAPAQIKLIGIGASTGGPRVLQTILAGLPKDFAAPVLIVQHIAKGFVSGMAEWLNQTTSMQVQIASDATIPLPGHVYLAPDDFHMGIGSGGVIVLTREAPENNLRPAVAYLFRTMAQVYAPERGRRVADRHGQGRRRRTESDERTGGRDHRTRPGKLVGARHAGCRHRPGWCHAGAAHSQDRRRAGRVGNTRQWPTWPIEELTS